MTDPFQNSDYAIYFDGSYIISVCMYSAFTKFMRSQTLLTEADLNDKLDITLYQEYTDYLKDSLLYCMKFFEETVLPNNFRNYIKGTSKLFVTDCSYSGNWRREVYADYKAQRVLIPKKFNKGIAFKYAKDFVEYELKPRYNLITVNHPNAEADDIIAVLTKTLYASKKNIIISSDRDYLQLKDNVYMLDVKGDLITIETFIKAKNRDVCPRDYTQDEFKLIKIIIGDSGDNVPSLKKNFGIKRCLKLLENKSELTEFITQPEIIDQFKLNTDLIDMDKIPTNIETAILDRYKDVLSQSEAVL